MSTLKHCWQHHTWHFNRHHLILKLVTLKPITEADLNVETLRWTSTVGEHVLTLQFRATILDKQPKTDNFSEYICTFTEADGGTTIYKSHQLTIANPVTRAASRSGCELFVSGGAKSQLTQRETMCVAETHKTCRKSKSSLKTYFTQTSTDHTAVS